MTITKETYAAYAVAVTLIGGVLTIFFPIIFQSYVVAALIILASYNLYDE